MFCKNCGLEINDDCKFCSNCGVKVENDVEQSAESTAESQENQEPIASDENIKEKDVDSDSKLIKVKNAGKLYMCGFISALIGVIFFLGIVVVGYIGWGEVDLYDGDDYVAVLSTISIILMLTGAVTMILLHVVNLKSKTIALIIKKSVAMMSVILVAATVGLSTWGFVNCAKANDDEGSSSGGSSGGSYGGSYGGGYNNIYDSGVDKRIGLSLKVDSIRTSGSYTYVYCSVKNVSSSYVATRYRYVKVKAQFKNYYGTIVDTDWTYAVDSTWLEPGESKTFYYMVQNTSIKSATLSFVD